MSNNSKGKDCLDRIGNLSDCPNLQQEVHHRMPKPLTYFLLTGPNKSVLEERILGVVKSNKPNEKYGFQTNRSTEDLIFKIWQILENVMGKNKDTYYSVLDLTKAFDKVKKNNIWKVL